MESNFEQLVGTLKTCSLSSDVLHQITQLLDQECDKPFHSLFDLQQWAWDLLSQDSSSWASQSYYQQLFHTLASFNKKLIFNYGHMELDVKAKLLFSATINQIDKIFQLMERTSDDNNPFITIVTLWFDNHSCFMFDNPGYNVLPVSDHINQYIAQNYTMSEQYKFYLTQLRQRQIAQSVFTAKMLFYIKTCSYSLLAYKGVRLGSFPFSPDEILRYIGEDYLHIVRIRSRTVASWNKELLACMARLISFTAGFCWWDGVQLAHMKIVFPTEQIVCDHVQDLMTIIDHEPFQKQIKTVRLNDETILISAVLEQLINIVWTQNLNWFFRSSTTIHKTLLRIAETSLFDEACLLAYGILGEVLADEQLKELKIGDTIGVFFFRMLEHAWHHSSKKYKQIPIEHMLQGYLNLTKHDTIQQRTADLNKIPFLIELSDQHLIVYDILWALSFNQDIQQQLRSSSSFMSKLFDLEKECDNEKMRKITHGILWNLEINHDDRATLEINAEQTFDIMISYSHKEKVICKQLYDELIKVGYRVWIDFDQMHGNVMDAMAQAIERSNTIIICMSEQYRQSNYCRAEAHYAFQRQRKIVPVLLQKHYKPDGWLLFLIGHLLYVDFNKHEFPRALQMLLKELKAEDIPEINALSVEPKEDTHVETPVPSLSSLKTSASQTVSQSILEWTQVQVQDWLVGHNLTQMSRLFADCDGRSLVYLSKYMEHGQPRQVLSLLQEDSLRRTNQSLSLIELSRFHSLIDEQRRILQSTSTKSDKNSV